MKTAISVSDESSNRPQARPPSWASADQSSSPGRRGYLDELAAQSLTRQIDQALFPAADDDSGAAAAAAGHRLLAAEDDDW